MKAETIDDKRLRAARLVNSTNPKDWQKARRLNAEVIAQERAAAPDCGTSLPGGCQSAGLTLLFEPQRLTARQQFKRCVRGGLIAVGTFALAIMLARLAIWVAGKF